MATDKEKENLTGCILFLIGAPLSIFVGVPLKAWILTVLWGWYAVPGFGFAPLTIFQALGVTLILNFILYRTPDHEDERPLAEQVGMGLVVMVISPALSLLFGWLLLKIWA